VGGNWNHQEESNRLSYLSLLNPLLHTFRQSDYTTVLGGISWLANPIVLVGMVALGVSEHRVAAVLGIIALGCALGAAPVLVNQLQVPAYLLWLGSMAIVVYGGLRRQERAASRRNEQRLGERRSQAGPIGALRR